MKRIKPLVRLETSPCGSQVNDLGKKPPLRKAEASLGQWFHFKLKKHKNSIFNELNVLSFPEFAPQNAVPTNKWPRGSVGSVHLTGTIVPSSHQFLLDSGQSRSSFSLILWLSSLFPQCSASFHMWLQSAIWLP